MNDVLSDLKSWGCDIKSTMERMCNDEEFYMECLQDITEDPNFEILKIKLDVKDITGAFDAAHTLKGILANVGLTPMYKKVVEIVESLRTGSMEDVSARYDHLMDMKKHLENILDKEKNAV